MCFSKSSKKSSTPEPAPEPVKRPTDDLRESAAERKRAAEAGDGGNLGTTLGIATEAPSTGTLGAS